MTEMAEEVARLHERSNRSITFGECLRSFGAKVHESPRGIERLGYYGLSIVKDESRALKKHDFWFVKEKTKRKLEAENRFSHVVLNIPIDSIAPSIRRYTGLTRFDISGETDYVVKKSFSDVNNLLEASAIKPEQREEAFNLLKTEKWKQFVEDHSSHVALIYRARITGGGIHNLAFYCEEKMFFGGSFWMIDIRDSVQAKMLTLYLNSTLYLFELLVGRKETEGGWIWIDSYLMQEFPILDLSKLSEHETKMLLLLFDKVGKMSVPSLHEQIEGRNSVRVEIDKAFLRLLDMPEQDIDSFLERLYSVLDREFHELKNVLSG
jgi:hypothetical protein